MMTLALEFSSAHRSVAVLDRPPNAAEPTVLGEAVEDAPGGARPLELIDRVLEQARVRREEIQCLAVGLGPGSYTGIRSAIAMAQGWQLARGVRLLGISSVECLVAQAQASQPGSPLAAIAIDAQRDEVYFAAYQLAPEGFREWIPLRLARIEEVRQLLTSNTAREMDSAAASAPRLIIGPEMTKWFPEGLIDFPRARTVGMLAAQRNDFVSGETLEPIYLRPAAFVKAPPPRVVP